MSTKITKACDNCRDSISLFPSRFKKSSTHFCNKSCHRSYKNFVNNPSESRDLSGANNPMFGKHPVAWNKDIKGEECHNWKGGVHVRKDGYVRINIDGKRVLYHRHILSDRLKGGNVVHHIDHNPSNNSPENLMVMENQSEHVRYERANPIT
jgi:hypothetical protein